MKDEEIFGGGFFDKIKKGLSVANNFLKQTGVISKFGKYIPHVGPTVSTVASSLGYASQAMASQEEHLTYVDDSVYQNQPLQVSTNLINNQKKNLLGKRLFLIFKT